MKKKLLILMISLVLPVFAYGAEEKKPSVLGEALDGTLAAFKDILSPYHYLDPIVVTPTRYDEPSLDVSNDISVIDEKAMDESFAKYVPDVLRDQSGIIVSDMLGNGKFTRVDMRGFGDSAPLNLLVLVDGRRTNQVDLSGADWIQIDPSAIERIEVVRGPQTVMYGDNATAGVVNIITKNGAGKKPEISFLYDVGSYRFSSYKGGIQGGTSLLGYFIMASRTYNNGYRINNKLETLDYNMKITLKPADYLNLTTSAGYHRDWYGLPGAVKPVDINSIGRRGSLYPDDRGKTEDYYYMLTPKIVKNIGFGELDLSGDLFFRARRTNAIYYSSFGDTSIVHHIRTLGLTPKAAFTVEFLGITNRLLGGFDYYGNADEINSGFLSGMDSIVINKKTGGAYLTDTIELPFHLILNGGVRSEWAYFRFDQQEVAHVKNEKKPFEYACEAGLTYKYNDRSSLYGRYSRSFRFPTTEEWYSSAFVDSDGNIIFGGLNLALKPQVANNYEIGIKENSSKYINVDVSYHIMDIKNELFYDPIAFQNAVYHQTIHHGLDMKTDVYLFDTIHAFFNYTYQKSFFVGEAYAGNVIPLVPKHKVSTGFKYTFKDCVNIIYSIDYVDNRRFANDVLNNMPKLKEYIVHNIKFSYTKLGLEIYAAINNLFDEEYTEYGALDTFLTRPGYYPSPRINGTTGVRYKF